MGRFDAEGDVAFGLQLPIQAHPALFAEGWEADAGVDELTAAAHVAEASGFDYVAVSDHLTVPDGAVPSPTSTRWDAVATLAHLAATTRRLRLLGYLDLIPERHPRIVAGQWATLDALSGGRALLGVGAGRGAADADTVDLRTGARGRVLDEAIDLIRAVASGEGGAPPTVWVEGSSADDLRRAATRGDGWVPSGPPEGGMSAGIARLHDLRRRAGRAELPFTVGARSGPLYVGEPRWDIGRAVHGSPEQIASFLRVLAGLGADQIQVDLRSRDAFELYDQIRVFGAEVAPLVGLAPVV